VRSKASAVLLLVRVNDVGDARPDARVKAMFLPVVVVMVLPLLYADCRLCDAELQEMTWFETFVHKAVPVFEVSPEIVRKLLALVLIVTPFVPFGEKVD